MHLAVSAVRSAHEHQTLLPLHLNLFGGTVAHDFERLEALHSALDEVGRRPHEITVEIGPPFARLDRAKLLAGVRELPPGHPAATTSSSTGSATATCRWP